MSAFATVVVALGIATPVRSTGIRAAGAYQLVEHWAQLPPGTQWGVMSWVSTDVRGRVYAFQRDEPTSKVLVFDASGKFLSSWGEGAFPYPHSLRVLRDGNVWIADRKMQQVLEYTPDGTLLMSIGEKGVAGDNRSRSAFNGVSDMVTAADGTIFASDGEGANTRVVKLSKDGTFIASWGTKGSGPGELSGPHCITMDTGGKLYVCDRGNKRIQVFDQDGRFLDQMTQFGTPVSIAIDAHDQMFVATPAPENRITIGTTKGQVLEKIEGLNSAHGIAVDAAGDIFVAESAGKAVLKYARQ
ncbi:MAG TPA: peptidyl-alpha-hydroxyglycine alpha-amidating lyase family protein [Vicinamibacterales bacterium]|nr:peptidyl-alpha-hydroxyglycine alpha-amidating lyase family protein [Vicinamibacterales bacterium]